MDFKNPATVLNLNNIRETLVRLEDTILFNLIERAQFYSSPSVYDKTKLQVPDWDGSFLDWFLYEYEVIQARIRRYQAPDEEPFFHNLMGETSKKYLSETLTGYKPDGTQGLVLPEYVVTTNTPKRQLPSAILPPLGYPQVLAKYTRDININDLIKAVYIQVVVPLVSAKDGDQAENFGSTTLCDLECLQAISRRIHFGKFVAESKFQSERELFTELIQKKDIKGIENAITKPEVEAKILDRLEQKAKTYGVDPTLRWSEKAQGKVDSKAVRDIYEYWIIPLTRKVEVDYLLRRLECE